MICGRVLIDVVPLTKKQAPTGHLLKRCAMTETVSGKLKATNLVAVEVTEIGTVEIIRPSAWRTFVSRAQLHRFGVHCVNFFLGSRCKCRHVAITRDSLLFIVRNAQRQHRAALGIAPKDDVIHAEPGPVG